MKHITLGFTESQYKRLKERSRETGSSVASILRRLVTDHLKANKEISEIKEGDGY